MSKLIALDDGHGMETQGKRTPKFPGTNSFMHENDYNRAVLKYLKVELERCGFRTLEVAPGDSDVPLSSRVAKANGARADIYVSIHANANTGQWGSWGGTETFGGSSSSSKKLAALVQKRLMQGTDLRDRGAKDGSHLYVLRNTHMPAILVEGAFMDNLEEAKLLLSDAFRKECAVEIAQGICDYFGVKYVSGTTATAPAPKPAPKVSELTQAIEYVKKAGISDGSAPERPITRGEFFRILYRMSKG